VVFGLLPLLYNYTTNIRHYHLHDYLVIAGEETWGIVTKLVNLGTLGHNFAQTSINVAHT